MELDNWPFTLFINLVFKLHTGFLTLQKLGKRMLDKSNFNWLLSENKEKTNVCKKASEK